MEGATGIRPQSSGDLAGVVGVAPGDQLAALIGTKTRKLIQNWHLPDQWNYGGIVAVPQDPATVS